MTNEIVHRNQSAVHLPQEWEWNIMERYANAAVKSGLVKDGLRPDQALFIILKGYELNITPIQALSDIHLISNKPGLSVQLMISLANRSGMLTHLDIPDANIAFKAGEATVTATRKDRPDSPITMTFTMADAEKAGLMRNPTWKSYPGQMLVNRAVSMVLRRIIPEALSGMYLDEELETLEHAAPSITISEIARELPAIVPDAPKPPTWWPVLKEYKPFMPDEDFNTMRGQMSEGIKQGTIAISDDAAARVFIETQWGLFIDLDSKRANEKEMAS